MHAFNSRKHVQCACLYESYDATWYKKKFFLLNKSDEKLCAYMFHIRLHKRLLLSLKYLPPCKTASSKGGNQQQGYRRPRFVGVCGDDRRCPQFCCQGTKTDDDRSSAVYVSSVPSFAMLERTEL